MQSGDINAKEHNSIGIDSKKVLLWGWYNNKPIKVAVTSSGYLKVAI
jgi:hypothetical protein